MPMQTNSVEYKTYTIGAGYLIKHILDQLDVVAAIDENLRFQPELETTYGTLAQVIIINRMTFDPQPLYHLAEWADQRGISRMLGIQSAWLDDDRLGAMLEGLTDHQAEIWRTVVGKGIERYQVELEWLHSDTTSVYFEGAYEDKKGQAKQETNGPLLIEGYNKDGQRQKGQFVLSLAACQRIPIWYTAWDGNQRGWLAWNHNDNSRHIDSAPLPALSPGYHAIAIQFRLAAWTGSGDNGTRWLYLDDLGIAP